MTRPDRPNKSKYERALSRSLAYLRLCDRRLAEAVEIQKSEPEFGKIDGLAVHVFELRASLKTAYTKCEEAQVKYLGIHGILCKTCRIRKIKEDFHKDRTQPNGYQTRCIVCAKARRG